MGNLKLVATCEHGGNKIPSAYRSLFLKHKSLLDSHRGYDIGAIKLFNIIARSADFRIHSNISRLLVELNRSIGHPKLFSSITKRLSKTEKERILSKYYFPYRTAVEQKIKTFIRSGFKVLHISVHSFTPVLNGKKRNTDIGLLYDPSRVTEKLFCQYAKSYIINNSQFKVRLNYPYLGKSDGFVTYLRTKFPEKSYIGIELEINQKILH